MYTIRVPSACTAQRVWCSSCTLCTHSEYHHQSTATQQTQRRDVIVSIFMWSINRQYIRGSVWVCPERKSWNAQWLVAQNVMLWCMTCQDDELHSVYYREQQCHYQRVETRNVLMTDWQASLSCKECPPDPTTPTPAHHLHLQPTHYQLILITIMISSVEYHSFDTK